MPTLPLYAMTLTAGDPESWHRVMAPGGYETWEFTAIDESQDMWLIATLSWGSNFLPEYLRQYQRYRRHPTRFSPPRAKQFCCASFALYMNGNQLTRFETRVNGDEFSVAKGPAGVHVGANRLTLDEQGKLHLHLRGTPWRSSWLGPVIEREKTVSANMIFEPVLAGASKELELLAGNGPVHRWTASRPLCRVKGQVSVFGTTEVGPQVIPLSGRGCHEHSWGVRPLSWDFSRGLRAVLLGEDRAIALRWHEPRRNFPPRAQLFGADSTGISDLEVNASMGKWAGGAYPTSIRFEDVLQLDHPQIAGRSLFDVRLKYATTWKGQPGVALCEIVNWRKLRSPVTGRITNAAFKS